MAIKRAQFTGQTGDLKKSALGRKTFISLNLFVTDPVIDCTTELLKMGREIVLLATESPGKGTRY